MMNKIIPLIILLLMGCAQQSEYIHTTLYVLDTNPQGATVICDERDNGYAPIILDGFRNIDYFGENRPFTDEEIAKDMEVTKIRHDGLKLGENKALTDEETINELKLLEAGKIVNGELKAGKHKVLTDEEVKAFIEAIKIVEGKLKLGEHTASIDEGLIRTAIQIVKNIKEHKDSICTAYWSSGVSKEYPLDIPFIYAGNGRFVHTLQRPEGEGYAQDAEFALKVKQLKQNQQNADRDAAIALRATQAQESAALANVIKESTSAIQTINNLKSINSNNNQATTTCFTNLGITTCY